VGLLSSSAIATASIGFNVDDCSTYGNLIEESANHRTYENEGIKYFVQFDPDGTVHRMEVKFPKGIHPSVAFMLAHMPEQVCKQSKRWKKNIPLCSKRRLALISEDRTVEAIFYKERWNKIARVVITQKPSS